MLFGIFFLTYMGTKLFPFLRSKESLFSWCSGNIAPNAGSAPGSIPGEKNLSLYVRAWSKEPSSRDGVHVLEGSNPSVGILFKSLCFPSLIWLKRGTLHATIVGSSPAGNRDIVELAQIWFRACRC